MNLFLPDFLHYFFVFIIIISKHLDGFKYLGTLIFN